MFHFKCTMFFVVMFINYSSICTFFETEIMYLKILFFKVLMNLSSITDFPSLSVECIPIEFFSSNDIIDLLQNSLHLSTHV